jgi:S-sulfosulfanyl-L-cysteine sulfohydrolase
LQRREFLRLLGLAAAGAALRPGESAAQAAERLYDVAPFGNVSLMHITDTHAQLLPVYFREPAVNRKYAGKTRNAYAFTSAQFEELARRYGKLGGFAHIATLVKRLRASRPHALLLDGGDSWQGSATALWTRGADMIGAQKLLGVDCMTGHWEFTYGAARLEQALAREAAPIEFLAQNVRTVDFEDLVFKASLIRDVNGVRIALIGQAYPYTPIANPRHFVADWTFGLQEARLQQQVDRVRATGAKAVILLSHNGLQIDLKLASRIRGLDAILGGHTHDALAEAIVVGKTLVTNAGCSGKLVSLLDLQVGAGGVTGYRHRVLPVFSNLLPPDPEMSAYIAKVRGPFEEKLAERLAVTEGLLYRRGTFNGTFDELILQALRSEKDAEIAFSPGFRWGTTLLPGDAIRFEHLMDQTAITYPHVTLNELSGAQIKAVLEDLADNLFNPDPYAQQGGDMVRVGGMSYAIAPKARAGSRISDLRIGAKPMGADRRYKVAGWAPVAEGAQGEPVWEVVARYLRERRQVPPQEANRPIILS